MSRKRRESRLETRKPIPGYPDYEADEMWLIWSKKTHRQVKPFKRYGRKGRGSKTARGDYDKVILRDSRNVMVHRYVHTLVALAWLGKPKAEGMEVDHLDGDKTNNRPENLEWVTREENRKRWIEKREA